MPSPIASKSSVICSHCSSKFNAVSFLPALLPAASIFLANLAASDFNSSSLSFLRLASLYMPDVSPMPSGTFAGSKSIGALMSMVASFLESSASS